MGEDRLVQEDSEPEEGDLIFCGLFETEHNLWKNKYQTDVGFYLPVLKWDWAQFIKNKYQNDVGFLLACRYLFIVLNSFWIGEFELWKQTNNKMVESVNKKPLQNVIFRSL